MAFPIHYIVIAAVVVVALAILIFNLLTGRRSV